MSLNSPVQLIAFRCEGFVFCQQGQNLVRVNLDGARCKTILKEKMLNAAAGLKPSLNSPINWLLLKTEPQENALDPTWVLQWPSQNSDLIPAANL